MISYSVQNKRSNISNEKKTVKVKEITCLVQLYTPYSSDLNGTTEGRKSGFSQITVTHTKRKRLHDNVP